MAQKQNIHLMYAIALLQGMVFYSPVAALYRQAAGITFFQITLIESISMALTIILEFPMGLIADKIGYQKMISLSCTLFLFSKIIFWRADSFQDFLAERLILSAVTAGLSGVDSAFLYLSCRKGESQKVFGIYGNLTILGMMAAAGVYAVFIGENYRLAGFLTVLTYGIAALLSFGLKEPARRYGTDGAHPTAVSAHRSFLSFKFISPGLLSLVIAAGLLNEVHQTITVFLNQLQYEKLGMSGSHIALAYIGMTALGLSGIFSDRLTKWLGNRTAGSTLLLLACIACLVLTLTGNAALAVAAVFLLQIAYNLFQPLQLELQNQLATDRSRAAALSLNAALMDVIAVFTNLIFGRAAEYRLDAALGLACIFCGCGFLLYRLTDGESS